jgi:hypothetical protein
VSDVALFLQRGWKNIWKQDTIFFFSALPLLDQLFRLFITETDLKASMPLVDWIASVLSMLLFFIGFVGVSYTAFCSSIDQSVTISDVLVAVKKFSGRILGCSCLVLLVISPCMFLALALFRTESTQPLQSSSSSILLVMLLSLFAALTEFTMFGFFSNDWGLRKSLTEAWALFNEHFGTLATLGIITAVIFRMSSSLAGVLTALIQSGFDITIFSKFNLINPSVDFSQNLLFVVLSGIGQIVLSPLNSSVFAVAYRKYREINLLMNELRQAAA